MSAPTPTHNQIRLLRIFLIGFVVLCAAAFLFLGKEERVEAAQRLYLYGRQTLVVRGNECTLSLVRIKATFKIRCAAFTPTPTNTLAPGPDETVFTFISEPNDYIGRGMSKRYTPDDSEINAMIRSDHRHLTVEIMGQEDAWGLILAVPEGQELVVGTYEGATRYLSDDADTPGLTFSGNGRACNRVSGRFEIFEADYDGEAIRRFHAKFEQHCEGNPDALFGEVQIVAPAVSEHETSIGNAAVVSLRNGPEQNTLEDGEEAQYTPQRIKRTLDAGESLRVIGQGCDIFLIKNKLKRIKLYCRRIPMTRTPTPPPMTTIYIRNLVRGVLCFEVKDTTIGHQCFEPGDWLYGTFPSGTYDWSVGAYCGNAGGREYFPPGPWLLSFFCEAADLRRVGELVPFHADVNPPLTPTR